MSDLHNESIFITGGGSGLGLALVERFVEEGAQVAGHTTRADAIHPHFRCQFISQLANKSGCGMFTGGVQRATAAGIPGGI